MPPDDPEPTPRCTVAGCTSPRVEPSRFCRPHLAERFGEDPGPPPNLVTVAVELPAPATPEPIMHRDYIETVVESLETCAADLRRLLTVPVTLDSKAEAERIYLAIVEQRRLLLYAFQPKPKRGAWRNAIGCAPRMLDGEMPEDVIRRLRGHDD